MRSIVINENNLVIHSKYRRKDKKIENFLVYNFQSLKDHILV